MPSSSSFVSPVGPALFSTNKLKVEITTTPTPITIIPNKPRTISPKTESTYMLLVRSRYAEDSRVAKSTMTTTEIIPICGISCIVE